MATIRVQIPSYGTYIDFPAGTSPDVIQSAMENNFPSKQDNYTTDTAAIERGRREFLKNEGTLETRVQNTSLSEKLYNIGAEPLRVAQEMVTMPVNAGIKSAYGLASIPVTAVKGADAATEFIKSRPQVQGPLASSMVSDYIGAGVDAVNTALPDNVYGDIGRGAIEAGMDIAALVGAGKVIKSAPTIATAVKSKAALMREQSLRNFENKKLDSVIDTAYSKAVRPSVVGKKTFTQSENAIKSQREAIKTIADNKEVLGLETANGLPTNLQEMSQAVKAAKDKIYNDYDAMKTATGDAGAVIDLTPIADEIQTVTANKVLNDTKPEVVQYAKDRADALRSRGTYTPSEMQEAIQIYNADLNAFYKNPSPQYASRIAIDARIVSAMRQSLDDAITRETGPGYQSLKNQYGALKAIEPEVSSRAVVDARKNPMGLLDFTDILTSGEALGGILTGNPMMFVKGAAGRGIKEWIKKRNNPNNIVKDMFDKVDKYHTPRTTP